MLPLRGRRMRIDRSALATTILVSIALAAIVGVGVKLRAAEPLSSPSLGAEDPYTHVVFTKEALERGWFGDSFYLGTQMYPPGLHALAGTLAPLSGVTLYDFARWSPVVFGAFAVIGMFLLAYRLGGPAAGLTAALLTAVVPESVFRTQLFFPTALDLAIVPAFLLLYWLAATSEAPFGAAAAFVLLSLALTFTHPWLVPLFAAPALVAVAFRAIRTTGDVRIAARQLALPGALAASVSAFAMVSRWTDSDTGFADFFAKLGPLSVLSRLDLPSPVLFVVLSVVLGAACAAGVALACGLAWTRARVPRKARIAIALVAGIALAEGTRFLAQHPPQDVDYNVMLGPVAIRVALYGVLFAFLMPSGVGDLGVAVGAALFPLTAFDVFHSPFWPSRTVAYLAVAVALLGAATVAGLVELALRATTWKLPRWRTAVAPVAILASVLILSSSVAAHPAPSYRWYHLYTDEEFAGFQRTASVLSTDPNARVIVTTWQPALMIKTLALPSQARFSGDFFRDGSVRAQVLSEAQGAPRYLVIDKYESKDAQRNGGDLGIVGNGQWQLVYRTEGGTYSLYRYTGGG